MDVDRAPWTYVADELIMMGIETKVQRWRKQFGAAADAGQVSLDSLPRPPEHDHDRGFD